MPAAGDKLRSNRATKWAQALTPSDRATYVREMAPVVQEIQSRMAACRRLNRKSTDGK